MHILTAVHATDTQEFCLSQIHNIYLLDVVRCMLTANHHIGEDTSDKWSRYYEVRLLLLTYQAQHVHTPIQYLSCYQLFIVKNDSTLILLRRAGSHVFMILLQNEEFFE